MKYMDFNGLDSAFDVDPIYFWSMSHQTFLVSMSHPSFTLYIYIEEGSNASSFSCLIIPHILYLCFQSPNYRSEPFNIIFILKYAWGWNFIIFAIFLLFFKIGTKSLFLNRSKNSDFLPILKNSKKIIKLYP